MSGGAPERARRLASYTDTGVRLVDRGHRMYAVRDDAPSSEGCPYLVALAEEIGPGLWRVRPRLGDWCTAAVRIRVGRRAAVRTLLGLAATQALTAGGGS